MSLFFDVPGHPIPWQRAGRGANGRSFTASKTAAYQKKVAAYAMRAIAEGVWDPTSMADTAVDVLVVRSGLGDIDNYLKTILDAMNRVVYPDDRCVKREMVSILRADAPGDERISVTVWRIA
jgi:hypothetical protein